jgi:hypothetical protein
MAVNLTNYKTESVAAFDLEKFRAPAGYYPENLPAKYKKRGRAALEHSLKGPVPMAWLCKAATLPGKCLAVGLALWYLHGRHKNRESVSLGNELLADIGVSRNAKVRCLRIMEEAGLVTVEYFTYRSPSVTLVVADPNDDDRRAR